MALLFPIPQNSDLGVLRELISRRNTSISVQIIIREGINLAFKMCDVDSKNYMSN
jgi:hypothetical protein